MPLQPLTSRAILILILVFAAFGAQQAAVKAVVEDMAGAGSDLEEEEVGGGEGTHLM